MTLEEIKAAIKAGKTVCWFHPGYKVMHDQVGQWLIWCKTNGTYIGLTWLDGHTMNGKPEEFYIPGEMPQPPDQKIG
jgi:hypothetical protein